MLRDRIEGLCAQHREQARVEAETAILLKNAGLHRVAEKHQALEDAHVQFVRSLETAMRLERECTCCTSTP